LSLVKNIMYIKIKKLIIVFLLVFVCSIFVFSIERFPRPEFESEYQMPGSTKPAPRSVFFEYLDVFVLIAALSMGSYLSIRKRSRIGIIILMLFSIGYFGFFRRGCVCPIGAIQNIVFTLFNEGYYIPISIILFFIVPLLFALFFGRIFCAAVCPLGAVQDLVHIKKIKIPYFIQKALSVIPYFYLGIAVLFAATGSAFIICRFDPFINIFRLSGNFNMIIYGALFLIAGIFIARPYCRFICPYGILLGLFSKFAKWHTAITNEECINCGLCRDSCPTYSIEVPVKLKNYNQNFILKRLKIMILLIPVAVIVFGIIGSRLNIFLARFDKTVRLAYMIKNEENINKKGETIETETFRASGTPINVLYENAGLIENKFIIGGFILGSFTGLVLILKLISLFRKKDIDIHKTSDTGCFSCGRCFSACPKNKIK